jgi:tRNA-dihydrouridine synthase
MGVRGAQLVYRPKIIPHHLMKAKKWQFLEKIKSIEHLHTFHNQPVYDGIQLMAKNGDNIKYTINFINDHHENMGIQFIDLNFCCPGHKVRPKFRGGELLKKPIEIIKVVDQVLKYTDLPISVKIRKGYGPTDNPYKLCKLLKQEFGKNLGWITINRAPVKMESVNMNSLESDLKVFQKAQEGLDHVIPLIANGSITTPEDFNILLRSELIDGIMIGRGALGNPLIFSNIVQPSLIQSKNRLQTQIIKDLTKFFEIGSKYSHGDTATWVSIGKLKRQLYYFIKHYYLSQKKDLPPGYGKSTWRHTYFSRSEFKTHLKNAFPFVSASKWVSLFDNIPSL